MSRAGAVVIVKDGRALLPAVIVDDRGKKLELVSGPGRPKVLPANKVVFEPGLSARPAEAAAWLEGWLSQLGHAQAELELEAVWELLLEGEEDADLDELLELVHDAPTPLQRAAAFLTLEQEQPYFKRKGDRYQPRPRAEVEAQLTGERRAQEQAAARDAFRAKLAAPDGAEVSDDEQRFVADLLRLACGDEESPEARRGKRLLDGVPRASASPEGAYRALVALGALEADANLPLIAAGLRERHGAAAREQGEALAAAPHELEDREDLTGLETIAVDELTTDDPDDALSIAVEPDGAIRVWVHVTDVAAAVPPGSPIDEAAYERGASLYLPEGRWSMLPPAAERSLALLAGEPRRALSLELRFAPDGALAEPRLVRSLIAVDRQTSYDEVDRAIAAGEAPWAPLFALVERLGAAREAAGALRVSLPELRVRRRDGATTIEVSPGDSPARQLVSEMMIQTGAAVAAIAGEAQLPAVYRRQDPPDEPLPERGDFPDEHSFFFAVRRMLPRGRLSFQPGPHNGLGLERYLQVTSPLRRYQDLVCQRQLGAWLAGQPAPLDADAVMRAAAAADSAARELATIERDRKQHWLLRELEGRIGERMPARVIGHRPDGRAQLLIEPILFERPLRADPAPEVGARLEVELTRVQVFRRELLVRAHAPAHSPDAGDTDVDGSAPADEPSAD